MRPIGMAVATLALLAAACTGGGDGGGDADDGTARPDHGRLAVLGSTGSLAVMSPDGSNRVVLVDGPEEAALQPTWSPDGERLAWTEFDFTGGGATGAVVTAHPDGSDRTRAEVRFDPFYYFWDPTGDLLAYLSPGERTLELGLVDVAAGGDRATTIATGQPFYFSWAPEGDRMFTHVGFDRLGELGVGGSAQDLEEEPGSFQAPIWSPDGSFFVYAVLDEDGQVVVTRRTGEDRRREVVRFEGFIHFLLSPDGSRLAYRVQTSAPPAQTVSLAQEIATDVLAVVDIDDGEPETVSVGNVSAFFWSPDGSRLLFITGEDDAARWHAWDGDSTVDYELFNPSGVLATQYLPFFDQYAQSLSFWAPDGESFVYAGSVGDGRSGIWVQPLEGEAVRVADGVFATWSPG